MNIWGRPAMSQLDLDLSSETPANLGLRDPNTGVVWTWKSLRIQVSKNVRKGTE